MIPPRPTTTINTRQQRDYPLPRRIRQLSTTHHKTNYQTGPKGQLPSHDATRGRD
ncbi:hypothetical protein OYE22_25320 [Streptomyces sp. 71268]|uniref:hypothetical protein n=1 Tax=Streptomyces sp. 71268 TaxID=3002640 RepID=UPI0023FA07F3|nr:hypothetical protein [Streptomyces sp. 71268]WEV30104.1 hypothetical protein OYE22_25320 [Streptomyces sp. 71268]